ncbi:tetratricopeptide repeat protein [Xanthomonas massiliensis]|uniref:tetratricopeptide repeat protein n=1 Tax=Xanthomonas massiliensis TaxID=1720302 RepID=UPI000A5F80B2|nr:hypothetical protein [Xanthomonas massiliensis]
MKNLIFAASLLPLATIVHANGPSKESIDLDGDGNADRITQFEAKKDSDYLKTTRHVIIHLSSLGSPVEYDISSETESIELYPLKTGELVVDRSDRSSRDAAEFDYSVYGWVAAERSFCLKADVSGTPANQLQGEIFSTDAKVNRYNPCFKLGEDERTAKPVDIDHLRQLTLQDLRAIKKGEEIPEYLAYEIATIVDPSTVAEINDAGYFQEQSNHLRSALIILNAVHEKFPRRTPVKINLADAYWKMGQKNMACSLYASYKADREQAGSSIPKRAVERSHCRKL